MIMKKIEKSEFTSIRFGNKYCSRKLLIKTFGSLVMSMSAETEISDVVINGVGDIVKMDCVGDGDFRLIHS